MRRSRQSKRRILSPITFLLLPMLLWGCNTGSKADAFPPGTTLDGQNLAGVNKSVALAQIEGWIKEKLAEKRTLVYNNTEVPITLSDLGVSVDLEQVRQNLESNSGRSLNTTVTVDYNQAKQTLTNHLSDLNAEAINATYEIKNDQMLIKPGQPSTSPSIDKLLTEIQEKALGDIPLKIEVKTNEVPPKITTEEVENLAFDGVIGEFTTKFAVSEKNRSKNLTLAAKAIDETLLKPGQKFSFNKKVGPRTPERGFKDAYVIIEDDFVKGTGGGICQVSSTLYNAVLLGDLQIVERSPHAVAINYVPLGQDATVSDPGPDFIFKNNTKSYIYIRSILKPGELTIKIYGKQTGKKVELKREEKKTTKYKTIMKSDYTLPPGKIVQDQHGTPGYKVKVWKIVQDANGTTKEKFLGEDIYMPANRILRVGTD